MLSAPDQCEHMKFIIKTTNCKKGIEIGVFTGYSALCMAEALPKDGKLIAIDISEEFTNLGKKYWKLAGLDDIIDLRLGPGVEILDNLINSEENLNSFDFAYVDADKPSYLNYYERIVKLLKPNGFIFFDNIMWSGRVADETMRANDANTKALFEVNQIALKDERVEAHVI
jgi:caffeoyl-CoA O-methyltransferase